MKLFFPKAWFATEKLMNNPARLFNFSDRGSLHFQSGILEFSGQKQSLRINNLERIDLISPRIPWISIAYSFGFAFVVLGLIVSMMPSDDIFTSIFIAVAVFSIVLPYAIFVQKAMLWVEIVFVDNENVFHRVYFLDASRLWLNTVGGVLDDTLKMYKELKAIQR